MSRRSWTILHRSMLATVAVAVGLGLVWSLLRSGDTSFGHLSVLSASVSVSGEPVQAAQPVEVGDVIETDERGRAEISYADGSLTRIDSATRFRIIELDPAERGRVALELSVGRVWGRLGALLGVGPPPEIAIGGAVTRVRTGAFAAECRAPGDCTVTVVEGSLVLEGAGRPTLVEAGQRARVVSHGFTSPEGTSRSTAPAGQPPRVSVGQAEPADLRQAWILFNLERDQADQRGR